METNTLIRTVCAISSSLFLLGGIVHTSMTPMFMEDFSIATMRFVAHGLLGVVVGLFNLVVLRANLHDRFSRVVIHLVNLLTLAFVLFYLQVDTDPQGYVMGAIVLVMVFSQWWVRPVESRPASG